MMQRSSRQVCIAYIFTLLTIIFLPSTNLRSELSEITDLHGELSEVIQMRSEPERGATKKEVTFLVYMAADNDLHPFSKTNIAQAQRIGSNDRLNVLVHLNTKYPGERKVTRKLYIERNGIIQDGPDQQKDSGDYRTLIEACEWAHTYYPAEKFILVLWDHGSGPFNRLMGNEVWDCCTAWWHFLESSDKQNDLSKENAESDDRAICYDYSTHNFLTDEKLRLALEKVCAMRGRKIDIIAFDACLMADIEIAYVLAPYAHYMVSSQETIPGDGYRYDKVLAPIAAGNMSIPAIAQHIVNAFRETYVSRTDDYTLSALDLSGTQALTQATHDIARILILLLSGPHRRNVRAMLQAASHPNMCTHFHEISLLDMNHLFANIQHNLARVLPAMHEQFIALQGAIKKFGEALRANIIANLAGPMYPRAAGLSIYFPMNTIDTTYGGLLWSRATAWDEFLRTYFAVRLESSYAENPPLPRPLFLDVEKVGSGVNG